MNNTTTDGLVSNRLYHVNDVVSAGNYSDDIDDQGTFNNTHSTIETANNYGYDELGNLVRDAQEEIASIEWTVYGKMKKITRTGASSKADMEFGYDASGNRLWKKVTPKGSGAVISTYYYLRDAQGNEMCRYVKYTNTSSQLMYVAEEHSIYGSSRVGVDGRKDTLYKAGNYSPSWGGVGTSRRALGLKSFELANHLGNVLVTVSDKPVYKVSSGTIYFQPEISSASDYYPFGAPITGRSYSSMEYRFGFNTQEKTDEIAGEGNYNTALFWEYDTRLGRRCNTDPVIKPWESSYACLSDNPILYTDPKGDFRTKFGAQLYKYSHGGRGNVSKANSGIHKGEWSVSQKVHREGGAEGNENRIDEVLIVQQGRWSWWQSNKTEKTQSNEDVNWNSVNTGLQIADGSGVAASAGREIALEYRRSQPLFNRVGMSANVKAISSLRTASQYFGVAGYGAAGLGTVLDINAYNKEQLSGARLGYNTSGTAVGLGVGYYFGPIAGAATGGSFYIGQQLYDGYMYWQQQMSIYLINFENGLKKGWVPGT